MAEKPSQIISGINSTIKSSQTIPTTAIATRTLAINTKSPQYHLPTTITFTDTVLTTISPSSLSSPYESSKPNLGNVGQSSTPDYALEHRVHQFLPVIIAFAILGVLSVLGCLLFLGYRFYRTGKRRQQQQHQQDENDYSEAEETRTIQCTPTFQKKQQQQQSKKNSTPGLSRKLSQWLTAGEPDDPPYQQRQVEPIRYEKSDIHRMNENNQTSSRRPSLAPSWLIRLIPSFFSTSMSHRHQSNNNRHLPPQPRHMSLPIITNSFSSSHPASDQIDNLNIPISSTFVPIDSSSLTLVPRSDIWLDPDRRRGVDELDMWERRKTEGRVNVPIAPQPMLWRFPQDTNAYPDSPEANYHPHPFENARRSIHIDTRDSRRSSTTMQGATSYQQIMLEPETSRSETIGYNDPEQELMQSSSLSFPQATYSNDDLSINDVRLARTVLEKSRLNNSSSRWLHFSGSRSF